MSLVTYMPLVLEIGHHDLTHRVSRSQVWPAPCTIPIAESQVMVWPIQFFRSSGVPTTDGMNGGATGG